VNIAMLRVATNKRSIEREGMKKGKNAMVKHCGMLSAGTNFHLDITQPQ